MLKEKLNLVLIAGIAICEIVIFSLAPVVQAQTSTAIEIRAQDYITAVSTITFPQGAPGDTVSNPSNDHVGDVAQTFGAAGTAKPVVTLVNTSGGTLTIWYNITTFAPDNVVSNEYYLINTKGAACASADAITNDVSFGADTTTGVTIEKSPPGKNDKDLYLKITLSDVAGKSGTSTLTILGETA